MNRVADCFCKILTRVQVHIDLMHHYFSVGFGSKNQAMVRLRLPQFVVVLDNAVTDKRQCVLADVRVCVWFGNSTVSRPACVSESCRAGEISLRQGLL